jgi:hypothetical protein
MKSNRGSSVLDILLWMIGTIGAVTAYVHITFVTYREVAPRLDRIENKLDSIIGQKFQRGE